MRRFGYWYYLVDDKQKKLFLVQSKWKNDGIGGIKEEGMFKMVNGIKKILNLDFSDANQKIKEMQNIIEEAMKDINY